MKDTKKVELILCHENKTWSTQIVEIPEKVWDSAEDMQVSQWFYSDYLMPADKKLSILYVGVYNWMEDENEPEDTN